MLASILAPPNSATQTRVQRKITWPRYNTESWRPGEKNRKAICLHGCSTGKVMLRKGTDPFRTNEDVNIKHLVILIPSIHQTIKDSVALIQTRTNNNKKTLKRKEKKKTQ